MSRVTVRPHTRRHPRSRGDVERYIVHVPKRGFVTCDVALEPTLGDKYRLTLSQATEMMDSLHGLKPELYKRV